MLVSKDHGFWPGREPGVTGIRSAGSPELGGGGGGPEGCGVVDAGGAWPDSSWDRYALFKLIFEGR
jgi:hypothetical protein